MNNTQRVTITTETKVALGILALTLAIIIGGITVFKKSGGNTSAIEKNISQYIQTDIAFDKNQVSPTANPKITGTTATYKGTSTASIEITEFMDYECPACATIGEPLIQQILAKYGSRVTITRRIFPVHGEPSIRIARMVLASQEVSNEAYQKLHAKVFETQSEWSMLGQSDRDTFFTKLTAELGLDYATLVKTGNTQKYAEQIDKDKADALLLGIKATPSFIIDYKTRVTGGIPMEILEKYIDAI